MHAETLPPFRHVSSRPISMADASKMLDKYLADSERHPHLHPDALITPTGVTLSAHGGPTGGVVMHNLRRVAAGLHGEYLKPEATPEPEEQEDQGTGSAGAKWKKGKKGVDATANVVENEWQSMSEFEREEGRIEMTEGTDTMNVAQEYEEAPEVEATDNVELRESDKKKRKKDDFAGMDKAAKKKAKKQRDKEFRKKKETARAAESKGK